MVCLAMAPPTRPRPVARLGYLLGMVVNEIPLLAMLYILIVTAFAVAWDDLLATWQGAVALLAAGAIVVGCAILQARVLRARRAVSHALGEPLRPRRRVWRSRLLPIPTRPRAVRRFKDLPYGAGGRGQRLDLYALRAPAQRPSPVVLYLHGGGYFGGDKRWESLALMYRLALSGWVVVSANYQLRPRVGYPEHVIDVKRAIAWVHRNSDRYGLDPSSLVVCGSSAGAHLALIAALSPGERRFQPGFEDVDTRVALAIGLYGYYGRYYGRGESEDLPSSPFGFDATAAPPVLLVHGDRDSYTSVEGARALAHQLKSRSKNPVVLVELPGAQHGFDLLASERFEAVVDGIETFLARALTRVPQAQRP
ncbi:alpha/beta hydrolase [Microbacterium wangchenii]|uniref:Alpha/beta hydrolase n=2 Tax=Microbacteriaceae TaxID=85023 RepID=A0ABX5SX37_9MICO|nr:alpha/beta hydrolase [Microbacterium wangchenii]TXK09309.1 alpha/beta hydrolase [Microbacterium wangchenii]